MQWEQLTSTAFAAAVRETGVCVLPIGVLERHSEHLPLGTDYLTAHRIGCLAAQKEPAVVFPPFYLGQIYEARCFPGTVAIEPLLLFQVLQGILDEIGRNGFKKIIIWNGHGGNTHLLHFLGQCSLWAPKPYSLYMPLQSLTPERQAAWERLRDTSHGGHACEVETSMLMAIHPDLVHMDRVPEQAAEPRGRLDRLPPTYTGIWWYANYPDHYAGDARTATAEKGQALIGWMVDTLAEYIAAVKADAVVPALEAEFFRRAQEVTTG